MLSFILFRHCLWILGNERTLTNSESVWRELVHDARNRNCLFDAADDECLRSTIIATKKELEELDDLVNGNSILFTHAKWKVLSLNVSFSQIAYFVISYLWYSYMLKQLAIRFFLAMTLKDRLES